VALLAVMVVFGSIGCWLDMKNGAIYQLDWADRQKVARSCQRIMRKLSGFTLSLGGCAESLCILRVSLLSYLRHCIESIG
jgi:hypothetical protein